LKDEYHYTFTLPRKWVWKWIKDETVLRNSITGCRSFNETSNGIYRGLIDIHFGPINDVFSLKVQRIQEKKPSFYRFLVKGKGNLGEIEGKMDLFFYEKDGDTDLTIKADAKFSGNLAITSELIEEGLRNISVERFFKKFEKEMKKAILFSRRKGR
jgi:carbon monoxide dehydrogenase subunit G